MMRKRPAWAQLVAIEPRLGKVLEDARQAGRGDDYFCPDHAWYGSHDWEDMGFKARVAALVGWSAEKDDDLLTTNDAYDVAYETVLSALPPCRECDCD